MDNEVHSFVRSLSARMIILFCSEHDAFQSCRRNVMTNLSVKQETQGTEESYFYRKRHVRHHYQIGP
jgi:hypothetical protein